MRAGVSREKDAIINIDDVEPYCYILRRKPPKLQLKKLTAKSIMEIFGALNNLHNRLFNSTAVQKPKRKQYTLKEVSCHCAESDCWMVIKDLVYDFTEFMREHPGGSDIMLEYAGTDATMAFADKPHSLDAWLILEKYLVGELVPEERMFDSTSSS